MTCPHCQKPLTIEELRRGLSPQELEILVETLGRSTSREAKRRADADRAKRSWAESALGPGDRNP